jgi:hypothetical protein
MYRFKKTLTMKFKPIKLNGYFIKIHKFYILHKNTHTARIYVFCMDLRKNSNYFHGKIINNINSLVFITETECVYCAVGTESLNIIQANIIHSVHCDCSHIHQHMHTIRLYFVQKLELSNGNTYEGSSLCIT